MQRVSGSSLQASISAVSPDVNLAKLTSLLLGESGDETLIGTFEIASEQDTEMNSTINVYARLVASGGRKVRAYR